MGKKYLVVAGNPIDGFGFHGAFDTTEEACAWGDENFNESGWYLADLEEAE